MKEAHVAKIVVAEDNDHLRKLYEAELAAEGHQIIPAKDGREAIEATQQHQPDCVVLDIAMPGVDGIEALLKILSVDNEIPVILNTAYASYKDNFSTWAAAAYVIKSGDLTELKETINRVLGEQEAAGEGEA